MAVSTSTGGITGHVGCAVFLTIPVVSGQRKSKACFATLAERKTRFYIAVKIPDRKAETMENAIVSVLSAFPPQLVKTITCDRGAEFANWRRIEERLHCDVYFADPEAGMRTKSWTGYAKRPNLCLYSRGLKPPRDSLIRLWLYQWI